jgi:hypothetical protein
MGKSNLLKLLTADDQRLLLVDTLAEHYDVAEALPFGEGLDRIADAGDGDFRVAIPPMTELDYFMLERVAASRDNITLAVDELDRWYRGSRVPLSDDLYFIVNYGRHFNQRLVISVRRPVACSTDIRAASDVWVFPQTHKADRKYVEDSLGFDPGELQVIERDARRRVLKTEVAHAEDAGEVTIFELDNVNRVLRESNPTESPEKELASIPSEQ